MDLVLVMLATTIMSIMSVWLAIHLVQLVLLVLLVRPAHLLRLSSQLLASAAVQPTNTWIQ